MLITLLPEPDSPCEDVVSTVLVRIEVDSPEVICSVVGRSLGVTISVVVT